MPKLHYRSNLEPEVAERFRELRRVLSMPETRSVICREVLSRQEAELVAGAEVTALQDLGHSISFNKILEVFAWTRGMSAECALLEIAKAIGAIRDSEYRSLRRAIGEPIDAARPTIPMWDAELGELRLNGQLVRRFAGRAKNLRAILSAFQEQGWPLRIDSPLSGGVDSRRLREAVRSLNEGLKAIRFRCDGKSSGILWEPK
jgi:hypothetical protein